LELIVWVFPWRRSRRSCDALDELADVAPDRVVSDAGVGRQKPHRGGVRHQLRRHRAAVLGCARLLFEEIADRHVEDLGDQRQAPGADPVHALFVFLHLLEGDAELVGQCDLGHAPHQAVSPDGRADLVVGAGRPTLSHLADAPRFH
jgi:uncharacterized protein YjiS (DUF1127 family)